MVTAYIILGKHFIAISAAFFIIGLGLALRAIAISRPEKLATGTITLIGLAMLATTLLTIPPL